MPPGQHLCRSGAARGGGAEANPHHVVARRGPMMKTSRCYTGMLAALFSLLISPPSVTAQGSAGQIEGTVRDVQGGVLPGVTTDAAQPGHGRHANARHRGGWALRLSGACSPAATPSRPSCRGFATQELSDIGDHDRPRPAARRRAASCRRWPRRSPIKGEAPVVDTTQAEVAGVVTRQQIETLPLNSRNYLSLALLVPGHDGGRDAIVLRDRQRRRLDDLQRHRQRRRRHDQQLGRGR